MVLPEKNNGGKKRYNYLLVNRVQINCCRHWSRYRQWDIMVFAVLSLCCISKMATAWPNLAIICLGNAIQDGDCPAS
jgi:hypothetical protein